MDEMQFAENAELRLAINVHIEWLGAYLFCMHKGGKSRPVDVRGHQFKETYVCHTLNRLVILTVSELGRRFVV